VERASDGTCVTQKLIRMCAALSSTNLRFISQQLQTSNSSKELTNVINLVNPCHICTYLQDPLLVQQFLLATVFSMIQNRCIQLCCWVCSHHFDLRNSILSEVTNCSVSTDKMQPNVAIFTTINTISLCLRQTEPLHAVLLPQCVSFAGATDVHVRTPSFLRYSCKQHRRRNTVKFPQLYKEACNVMTRHQCGVS